MALPTKQEWADGLRWMRDKFAGWLASVTVFSFLWIAVGVAVAVLFIWDGVWSRHQAPSSLDPITFQAAGWTLRLWTVFGLAAALWCFRHGARWVGGAFMATWIATSVMTYGHALGFMMAGQAERYAVGDVAEKKVEITIASLDDQIAEIEKQKTEVRADLALAVAPLNEEIRRLDTDGKLNEELANKQKDRRDALQDAAAVKINALDEQILALRTNHKADQITGTEAVAVSAKFDPLYTTLAEWTDGKPGRPDDETARAIGQKTGAFWAFLVEMIGGAGVALLYAVHAHMAARKPKHPELDEEISTELPPGHARWEGPEADLEGMMSLWTKYQDQQARKKRQAEDKAPAGSPLRLENKEWVRGVKEKIQAQYDAGMAPQDIASSFGWTWPEYENFVVRMFNKKAAKKYLGQPSEEAPDPRAAVVPEPPVAVADSPQPEPEIAEPETAIAELETEIAEDEPEPEREWGVQLYEGNLTDQDDNEGAERRDEMV